VKCKKLKSVRALAHVFNFNTLGESVSVKHLSRLGGRALEALGPQIRRFR